MNNQETISGTIAPSYDTITFSNTAKQLRLGIFHQQNDLSGGYDGSCGSQFADKTLVDKTQNTPIQYREIQQQSGTTITLQYCFFNADKNLLVLSTDNDSSNKLAESKQLFDQILSSLTFSNIKEISTPTPTLKLTKINILDTSTWKQFSCGPISYKLPENLLPNCENSTSGSYNIKIANQPGYFGYTIYINNYDGGSRRQYWINNMKATSSEISKYVRFQESQFGNVVGLDVFASNGWWQGGYASPILIAQDKTIVSIYGSRNYDEVTGKITRWDITDTIASTIKFL